MVPGHALIGAISLSTQREQLLVGSQPDSAGLSSGGLHSGEGSADVNTLAAFSLHPPKVLTIASIPPRGASWVSSVRGSGVQG